MQVLIRLDSELLIIIPVALIVKLCQNSTLLTLPKVLLSLKGMHGVLCYFELHLTSERVMYNQRLQSQDLKTPLSPGLTFAQ